MSTVVISALFGGLEWIGWIEKIVTCEASYCTLLTMSTVVNSALSDGLARLLRVWQVIAHCYELCQVLSFLPFVPFVS
jgi:hypothetical protein